jgi:hypothetical protein
MSLPLSLNSRTTFSSNSITLLSLVFFLFLIYNFFGAMMAIGTVQNIFEQEINYENNWILSKQYTKVVL